MTRYEIPIPPGFVELDGGKIEEFLRSRGFQTAGVSVRQSPVRLPTMVVVEADRDPSGILVEYEPPPALTPEELLALISVKPEAERSLEERLILHLSERLEDVGTDIAV